ncbi:MAG: hypothetical protein HZB16_03735 [Armatimonadetes bacterium]|nr:hypothetical protein [Armatimonadota bacterium]
MAPLICLLSLLSAAGGEPRSVLDLSGRWELTRASGEAAPVAAPVPAAWENSLGLAFDGIASYRLRVTMPTGHARYRLRLWGAATEATVVCNGREVGRHLGAWTPFDADLTAAVTPGRPATLEVRLDERVGHNTQGFLPIIAPHFGGLWQRVELLSLASTGFDDLRAFTRARADGRLTARLPLDGQVPAGAVVRWSLSQAGRHLANAEQPALGTAAWQTRVACQPWSVGHPNLYDLRAELWQGGRCLDRFQRRVGFREARAEGDRILLNGQPVRVRGVLNWGYYPPSTAPIVDRERFRREVRYLRDCGFNLIKFCLWIPPRELLDVLDEEGLLAWIEYPTWHPKLDRAHQAELTAEYAEFGRLDGGHPCAVVRSLTCETGPSADLDVLRALYQQAKALAPDTLVEDDSSWIGWNRVSDLWDDHSYGNNRWWRGQLAALEAHGRQHGVKPLLLGEAIAADTWEPVRPELDAPDCWWRPRCQAAQARFERELAERFGAGATADLAQASRAYALAMRRWQIETFTDRLPHAGYVVSTQRDFTLARMGLWDDGDQPKWSVADWAWHGEHTTPLRTAGDQRGFVGGESAALGVKVPGDVPVLTPRRKSITRTVAGRELSWGLWQLPRPEPVPNGTVLVGDGSLAALFDGAPVVNQVPAGTRLVVASALTRPVLDWMRAGGAVLHLPSTARGAFITEGTWWLRGTVWQPPAPTAWAERVPPGLLAELQLHELGGETVIRGEQLYNQVDPLLTFIETHDLDRVRPNLLVFDTAVDRGRLVVSALRHLGPDNAAGLWLARELARWALSPAGPSRQLAPATVAALRESVDGETQRLEGPWRFATDARDEGLAAGWAGAGFDDGAWRALSASSAAEGDIWNRYDGWGWYRRRVNVPASWAGRRVRLVFDSVDDMYEVYVNGRLAGGHGKLDRSESSYLKRTWVDVTAQLKPGATNVLAIRVYDWVGSGGLGREALLTTGPVLPGLDLLRR